MLLCLQQHVCLLLRFLHSSSLVVDFVPARSSQALKKLNPRHPSLAILKHEIFLCKYESKSILHFDTTIYDQY
eukprot:m.238068 g.238068  ORF g.238068 m.238068 type:complete len:73 (+) comp47903_c0_seq1:77-295(+)